MRERTAVRSVVCAVVLCAASAAVAVSVAAPRVASGATVHYKVVSTTAVVATGTQQTVTVKCPAGMVPVGGGGHDGDGEFHSANPAYSSISQSDINLAGNGWSTTAVVTSESGRTAFTFDAVCASF